MSVRGRALVMGILNVTPDSFSDGGRYVDHAAAVAHGRKLAAEGADIVDVGGESTRPGAVPVEVSEELRRVLPVIEALSSVVRVSVDTRHATVAAAAIRAGATIVNDVSATLCDVAAEGGAGWVAMHMQGEPPTMQDDPRYDDVVGEVRDHLVDRAARGAAAGVREVWIDPGIGFGKTDEHNLALLRDLDVLVATGLPVLVGVSRKGTVGRLAGGAPLGDRLDVSVALAAHAASRGVAMVRVHDVAETVAALDVIAGSLVAGSAA